MIENITKIILFIILTFVLHSCSPKEKRVIYQVHKNGKTKEEYIYKDRDDTLNYTRIIYYESGLQKSCVDYHDGKFNGKIIEYTEKGKKKFEATAEMSHFVGLKYNYYENGNLKSLDSLIGKCPNGYCCCDAITIRYYPNGKIHERFIIKNGLFHGPYISFYENGQKESERHFENDKEINLSKHWNKYGKLISEVNYKLGKPEGKTIEYYKNYRVEGEFINGKEEGKWIGYDSSGKVISVETYVNGVKTK